MRGTRRARRFVRAVEQLETRWLFSFSAGVHFVDSSDLLSSASGGCESASRGTLQSQTQPEAMVYAPPGSALTPEELDALAEADHVGGPVTSGASSDGASANFVTSGLKWPQSGGRGNPFTITYSLSNLLTEDLGGNLNEEQIYSAVEESLGLWAKYSPINFVEVVDSGPAVSDSEYSAFGRPNIRIGQHSEDGKFNVLAHAFFPDGGGRAGDVHLDSDETWTVTPSFSTIDMIEVLTHELGHSLGLDHENSNDAIMNPFYGGRFDGPGTGFLLQDDINGIRAIYGTGVGSVTPLPRTPETEVDAYTVEEDGVFSITESVLLNDTDPRGGVLTAELVNSAAHGNVTLHADGTFTYTPNANFFGTDTFTYLATNDTFSSAPTLVTLAVKPTLDLPAVTPDTYALHAGETLNTGRPAESVISAGDVWKFLDDGSNQGTAWRGFDFDDASWSAGAAQLGYGEGDEATVVDFGGDANARHITTYFRNGFDVADVSRVTTLQLSLQRDDGAAVYLNGVPIARSNLSASASFTTTALVDITGSSESRFFNFTINVASLAPGTLREGANVLAVELHQSRANSDDLTFDLKLDVLRDVDPNPSLNDADLDLTGLDVQLLDGPAHGTLELNADGGIDYTPALGFSGQDVATYRVVSKSPATLVATGANWRYLDTGADLGTDWYSSDFADSAWEIGDAQLGYGDGDEKTSISFGSASNRFATTYFRKEFTVAEPDLIASLAAELLRDDAAAVYLNGVEIYRDANLPAGSGHSVYSGDPVGDENAFVAINIPTELLTTGTNVLAVEVHQSAADDPDLSFDFHLVADVFSEPTTITFEVAPGLDGDVNFDNAVDLEDLNLVRGNFGGDASVLLGDANRNGAIDLADLNAVRNNFGAVGSGSPAALAAPQSGVAKSQLVAALSGSAHSEKSARVALAAQSSAWDAALSEVVATHDALSPRISLLARRKLAAR